MPHPEHHILLVDDDAALVRAYAESLTASGWQVDTASDGREAADRVHEGSYDVIISDVGMPRMNGVDFLRAVREHDLDVPVILMTGAPDLDVSIRAIEYGAFRYLPKPVDLHVLEQTVHHAAQLHSMARLKRDALEFSGIERRRLGDRAGLEARFGMAMKMVWMAYQPIVSMHSRLVFGYEAFLRSYEPTLREAADILDAAERLGRIAELGRRVRANVVEDAVDRPFKTKLLVNVHPLELSDLDLYSDGSALAAIAPSVVLEITERASLDGVHDVAGHIRRLRAMGFQIALDDLGAGYAGLTTFSRLEPDVAKLDISLVRHIHLDPRRRTIVRAMIELCDDLGTLVVAEGVESIEERDTLCELGCDLVQGFLFAEPSRGFPAPAASAIVPSSHR